MDTYVDGFLIPVATAFYRRLQGARMSRTQAIGATLIVIAAAVLILLLGWRP